MKDKLAIDFFNKVIEKRNQGATNDEQFKYLTEIVLHKKLEPERSFKIIEEVCSLMSKYEKGIAEKLKRKDKF